MSIDGIIIGAITFLVIGVFHLLVIYGEYHFGIKLWPFFLCTGILLCSVSLFLEHTVLSAVLGITAFSCFWSIYELFKQKKRVERGWFPKKQNKAIGLEHQKKKSPILKFLYED
jgi:uncharacterized membrane protein YuzA (DUF378 family)